ncbi:hypothetical protein ACSQ67_017593 [Phaseolus vulgaris]
MAASDGSEYFELGSMGSESFAMASNSETVAEDEEELQWAALSRLPSQKRINYALLRASSSRTQPPTSAPDNLVDVRKLSRSRRELVVKKALATTDQDNYRLLCAIKERFDRVGLEVPKIEVRFKNLNVSANVQIGSRALPTLLNYSRDCLEGIFTKMRLCQPKRHSLTILNDVSGVIKPGRMTLLLGPPGAGKSSLLLALAGKLDKTLKKTGSVTYNGHEVNEFFVRRTSAYISQTDDHVAELTVRECLDFAARCQGAEEGFAAYTSELGRLEKERNVRPSAEVDAFMKASSVGGLFRMMAAIARDMVLANTYGSASLLVVFLLGGFIIPKAMIKPWWIWGYWLSPLTYGQRAITVNEFTASRWMQLYLPIRFFQQHGHCGLDLFESFYQSLKLNFFSTQLLLMKRGGRVIYGGKLGVQSQIMTDYFQLIEGLASMIEGTKWNSPIPNGYNPATWVLEVTTPATEEKLNVDFADLYKNSDQYRDSTQELFVVMGALYSACMFLGVNNASSVQPIVSIERTVFYREKAAGMYSPLAYAAAQSIPGWWIWFYYICPIAWTLRGIITSQLGDVETNIVGPGFEGSVKEYLSVTLGYETEVNGFSAVGLSVIVLLGFIILFFGSFAVSVKVLNFQKR